jgi:hypothetical protein
VSVVSECVEIRCPFCYDLVPGPVVNVEEVETCRRIWGVNVIDVRVQWHPCARRDESDSLFSDRYRGAFGFRC